MLIFDSHLDLAWNVIDWGRDLSLEIPELRESEQGMEQPGRGRNTVSIPERRKAEVGLVIATLLAKRVVKGNPPFVPYRERKDAYRAGQEQLECYREMCEQGDLVWIRNSNDLTSHLSNWHRNAPAAPLGFLLSMEGADSIESPSQLPEWWEAGLRIIGPAHFGVNQYVHGTGTEGGFTPEGFQLLCSMEQAGFILDMTHLADKAFLEAADRFKGPVLASHHNSRTLVPGQRQLSDEQMRILLDREAVIGVALDAWMLTPNWIRGQSTPQGTRLEAVVDHIDYICQMAGDCSHVGIGSDLDGGFGTEQTPEDLDTIADLQKLKPILERRGYSEEEIKMIFHGNWITLFQRVLAS